MFKTERTLITALSECDVDMILKYYSDNRLHLAPWEPERQDSYFTASHFSGVINESQHLMENKQALKLVALTPDKMKVIGVCNFTNIVFGPFQACNLGYSLAEKYQGQGFMAEILRAATDFIFCEYDLHRIMANYIPENARSGKLLKNLGFEQEGIAKSYLKISGRWQDHVLTSKINPSH